MTGGWQPERRRRDAAGDEPPPPPRLQPPLGQGEALSLWLRQARRLRLPHALLVEGAVGSGKTTVRQWLAAALLCPSELDPDGPCGVCRTCLQVASGSHPDLHAVTRAQDEDDKKEHKKSFYVLKVDQIRQAQQLLQRHAVAGRARVLAIDPADAMEEEAQNALLKTLEEPGEATFLLLEASRPEQLLPTVRSRVQRLRVLPLPEPLLAAELQRRLPVPPPHLEAVLAGARGSLGAALAACTEQALNLHHLVQQALAEGHRLRPVALARSVLQGAEDRRQELDAARLFLRQLRQELRRRGLALAAAGAASYPDAPVEPWTSWLECVLAAERDLDLLIPPEQVLVACLLGIAG